MVTITVRERMKQEALKKLTKAVKRHGLHSRQAENAYRSRWLR